MVINTAQRECYISRVKKHCDVMNQSQNVFHDVELDRTITKLGGEVRFVKKASGIIITTFNVYKYNNKHNLINS